MVSRILGPDGEPVDRGLLGREVATPTLAGLRAVHHEAVASGLTPERIAQVLRQAATGSARDYLTLAEEMEERYLHYGAQVQTRRLAIEAITPSVQVPKGVPARVADAVHELVADSGLVDALGALTDGIAKGYAVVESIWEYQGGLLRPVALKSRDQRFFLYDRVTQTELRLAVDGEPDGAPLAAAKFVVHAPRSKTGIPIRRGFARAACWAFLVQQFTLKDWAAFSEIFGMPLRLGKYHAGASDADKRALLRAVAGLSSDAAAIIPQGMEIAFVERKALEGSTFEKLIDYVDRNVSKLVVGQTMTADKGASLAQAKVHNEVRLDILRADCRQLAHTVNADLVQWFVALNFGPQDVYPRVELPVAEPEDTTALADGVAKLVPLGLKVSQNEMRSKFGLSEPAEGDELLGPAPPAPAVAAPQGRQQGRQSGTKATLAAHAVGCACTGCLATAAAAGPGAIDVEAELEDLADEALADWAEMVDPLLAPLREAIDRASSFDELQAMLPDLARRVDGRRLAEALERLTAMARGLGDRVD
jgi:phage gp29-like protein